MAPSVTLSLRRLSAWLLALCTVALLAMPAAAADRKLAILYTGFTGGLSSGTVDFAELKPLFHREVPRDFTVGGFAQDNVFRHGDHFLYTPHGPLTLEDFRAFFAAGPFELAPAGTLPVLVTDYVFLFQHEAGSGDWLTRWLERHFAATGDYPDARVVEGRRYVLTNRDGLSLSLVSLADAPPPMTLLESPSRWEMLQGGTVTAKRQEVTGRIMAAGRLLGDGLRRAWLLQSLRDQHAGRALTVDVGNMLDPGHSELSVRQREFTFLQLEHMGYDALVPAETELGLEPADWERLRARVPLLAANLEPQRDGLAPLPGVLIKEVEGLKLALVGVVDDRALLRHGVAGPHAAWKVTDPVAAAERALAEAALAAPDAIVLLTNVRDERLQTLRLMPGSTAIIGDFMGLPGDTYKEVVELAGLARRRTPTPHMVARSSQNRVGRLEIAFEQEEGARPALVRLANEARLAIDHLPSDPTWRWQLNLTLDRYQRERRALLLPDLRALTAAQPDLALGDRDLPMLDAGLWSRLVANVTRQATEAEVAVIRRLPIRSWRVGPLSQLTIEGWLEVGDRLVQTTLSGAALKALAAQDDQLLTFSGFDPESKKVLGQPLVDTELYRVTTTHMVTSHARFAERFAGRPLTERWLVHPAGRAQPYAEGQRAELRELVVKALQGLKARHGGAFDPAFMADYAALLGDHANELTPRWTIGLEDGQILINSYSAVNNAAFSEVRNTRVTTPSSFAFGGKGRLSTTYDARPFAWENRVRAVYKRATLRQDGVELTQETDDEVVLTSEFRWKGLEVRLAEENKPLMPFLNSNYVTQFTPDELEGQRKPRRQELNAVGGLVFYPGFGLKEIRAGGVVKNDLVNPGFLEPGLQAVARYEQKLDPYFPGLFKAGFDITHYFDTPTDTRDRLGLLADLNAALVIPLWDRINLSLSADYFLFRGKVPETAMYGSSLDFKVGLGYSLGFKPLFGVWF
ncbi:MAG: hypothetical protein ACLGIN_10220 [Candidatus Sericytochromatia bacterium]